jgi:hypothetical protein
MIETPLLDDDYREAFFYLIDEINEVRECSDAKRPWFPKDEDKLESNRRVYERWHPDEGKNSILNFPWPIPGSTKITSGHINPLILLLGEGGGSHH